jgi:hypothetical protein
MRVKKNKVFYIVLVTTGVLSMVISEIVKAADPLDRYNVVWDSPSENSSGSMPIGNGDIGLNVWVEEGGDLLFYIGKTDTWDERGELLKLGRIRVGLKPNPFQKDLPFKQILKLAEGEILIRTGGDDTSVQLRIWVDANHPVIHVHVTNTQKIQVGARIELWRNNDTVLPSENNRIVWYHRNETSNFTQRLKAHNLQGLEKTYHDPLLHRTFGCVLTGTNMKASSDKSPALVSDGDGQDFHIRIHALTAQTKTPAQWLEQISAQVEKVDDCDPLAALAEHRKWWRKFWNRSWIYVEGDKDAETVTRGYTLQRWVTACGGRGAYPIKFNGSIFTADWPGYPESKDNPDHRTWGPDYWVQNTRFMYWPMIVAGDFDLVEPLFRMQLDTLPLQKERTKSYFGHAGAYYPETMNFWGLSRDGDYGTGDVRKGKEISWHENRYIRREWQGAIEILAIMLDYYAYTGNHEFLKTAVLPYANEILTFYDLHYQRNQKGKIVFHPAQALETWWECTNPMPEIAGLKFTLGKLIALDRKRTTLQQRAFWQRLSGELPELPTRIVDGKTIPAPADSFDVKRNIENPELYAVFPYRIYGVGKADLQSARLAFEYRWHKIGIKGHDQDDIHAAYLGLTRQMRAMIVKRFGPTHQKARFPAFWHCGLDWLPDQCHGGAGMITLQAMLMQCEDEKIILFPAWPKDWNVEFKLHGPFKTTVEGVYRDGKLQDLKVTPKSRAKDVVSFQTK